MRITDNQEWMWYAEVSDNQTWMLRLGILYKAKETNKEQGSGG